MIRDNNPMRPDSAIGVTEIPKLDIEGRVIDVPHTFYRGEHTNFLATASAMAKPDALAKHVLAGWMPVEPFIDRETTIVAFGSCFAVHIGRYLQNLGFDVATKRDTRAYVSSMGDGIVNTYAIRQQFEWAWEARVPRVDLWHGYKAEEFGYDEAIRLRTRELFDSADVFVLTLGLSEVWYDEPTGEVFWRAVPYDKFDPSRHKFRVVTPAENYENLLSIYRIIRKYRPDAAIVFTLSPIPLTATFRSVSCISANSVSKANLRSAVDELMRNQAVVDPKLYYFPSYEIITSCFRHVYNDDLRHPYFHLVDLNMRAFERYFCTTGMTDEELASYYMDALIRDRQLGSEAASATLAELAAERDAWFKANPGLSVRRAAQAEKMKQAAAEGEQRKAERQKQIEERKRAREERRAEFAERVQARAERLVQLQQPPSKGN